MTLDRMAASSLAAASPSNWVCKCGRPATHFITRFSLEDGATGQQFACDMFPSCRPPARPIHRGAR